ncbi:MAG TPA: hemerythrin domain-containing protein [Polyangiaceae bacterium]|nr:hemerythrin domain-containing protein [Polyangiaceae bacterium]
MNAIDLLEQQHREVEDLFEQIEEADDSDDKQALFDELADALAIHATIEERHFYPAAFRDATEDLLRESLEEHLAVKRETADMMQLDIDDEQFDAKCEVLKEMVQHHVKEEENELFPKTRRLLGTRTLEQIGEAMENTVAELEAQGAPRNAIPSETEHAPSLE